jgi:hypothetical protein
MLSFRHIHTTGRHTALVVADAHSKHGVLAQIAACHSATACLLTGPGSQEQLWCVSNPKTKYQICHAIQAPRACLGASQSKKNSYVCLLQESSAALNKMTAAYQ